MDTTFYTGAIGLVVLLGLIGTLYVARNPEDKHYGTTNKRFINLGIIYLIVIVIALVALVSYIVKF